MSNTNFWCPQAADLSCPVQIGCEPCGPCSTNNCCSCSGSPCSCSCSGDPNNGFKQRACTAQSDDTPKSISFVHLSKPVFNRQSLGAVGTTGASPKPVNLRRALNKGSLLNSISSKKAGSKKSRGRSPNKKSKTSRSSSSKKGKGKGSKTKGKGKKSSKSKGGNKSKGKKKSGSKGAGKSKKKSKKKVKSKSSSKKRSRSKGRGRSKKKSGRKPRGPRPTPVSANGRQFQTQAIEKLEKFNKFRFEQGAGSSTLVSLLRGYSSEPDVSDPCSRKLDLKADNPKRSQTVEDMQITDDGTKRLSSACHYTSDDTKDIDVSPSTWRKWYALFEAEKRRYSFYDELFAKKHVTDSMELPRCPEDIGYLIDADDEHYRRKLDYGRVVLKTKHIYTGNFVDWYFHGPGRYVWLDGGVYQGDFVNGVMHGHGTFLGPDGSIYEGEFHEGARKGWGVYTMANGYMYSGEWAEGVPCGNGKIWYSPLKNPNNFYDGSLSKGLPEGFGVRQYGNGDKYVGMWQGGLRHGLGTMLWRDLKQMYRGEWSEGLPHGTGIQVWYFLPPEEGEETENKKKHYTRHIFKGSWENGARHGKGVLLYPDTSVYEGEWEGGRQLRDGEYTDPYGEAVLGLSCIQPDAAGFLETMLDKSTWECVFKKLLESLSARVPIKSSDSSVSEEHRLINICFKYLTEFRLLYQRAMDLGVLWSNNSLSARSTTAPKSKSNSGAPPCDKSRREDPLKNTYGNVESIFTQLNGLTTRDEVMCSRLGLWLFVKDCEETTNNVTMAHYEKCWQSIPSICLGRSHPSDTVQFWQFLQCLMVVAFEIYAGIPFERSKIKYKCGSVVVGPEGKKEEERIMNGAKGLKVNLSDDDFIDMPRAEDGTMGRRPSKVLETDEPSDTDDFERRSSSESGLLTPPEEVGCGPISMADLFERFINQVLMSCFNRVAGKLLPALPNPLPTLSNLYTAFTSIRNEDTITALDLLFSLLPHRVFPEVKDAVYWTRSRQILSPTLDYDLFFQKTRALEQSGSMVGSGDAVEEDEGRLRDDETEIEDGEEGENKSSEDRQLVQTFPFKSSPGSQEEMSGAVKYCVPGRKKGPAVQVVAAPEVESIRKARTVELRVTDVERELLIPDEVFALDQRSRTNGASQPKTPKLRGMRNLESDEVIGVLRTLYPALCGSAEDTNLNFEMTFCDWLWAVILCSKLDWDKSKKKGSLWKETGMMIAPPVFAQFEEEEGPEDRANVMCSACSNRSQNKDYYANVIMSTFKRHQELRRGELSAASQSQGVVASTTTSIGQTSSSSSEGTTATTTGADEESRKESGIMEVTQPTPRKMSAAAL